MIIDCREGHAMAEQAVPRAPGPRLEVKPAAIGPDEGRLVGASTGRLVAILVMLVLFCEVVWMQLTMTSVIVRQIAVAFPASGNSTSWAITISTLVAGATIALVGKIADLWGKKRVMFACAILFLIGT